MTEMTLQQLTENIRTADNNNEYESPQGLLYEANEYLKRGADIAGLDCGRWSEDPRYIDRERHGCTDCTTWFACPLHYVHRELGMKYLDNLRVRSEQEEEADREAYYKNDNQLPDTSHMCGSKRGG